MIYAKDLLRDKEHIFIHKHYFKIHTLHFFTLLMISPILVYALYIFPAMYSIIVCFCKRLMTLSRRAKNKTCVTLLFSDDNINIIMKIHQNCIYLFRMYGQTHLLD